MRGSNVFHAEDPRWQSRPMLKLYNGFPGICPKNGCRIFVREDFKEIYAEYADEKAQEQSSPL